MAISGLMSNTALPAALLAASEQPSLAAGDIVAGRVVGQAPNGASQVAIGKQVVAVALPEHPTTGTVLLLQVGGDESGQRFTVLAEVAPEAAAHTALVPPQARLRLQALGLMPEAVFSAMVVARSANGLTRLAVGDTLIELLLPRPVAAGETVRLQMPRDWNNLTQLRLLDKEVVPARDLGQVATNPRIAAALTKQGLAPGAIIDGKILGRSAQGTSFVAVGGDVLELTLPQTYPAGTGLRLKWPAEGGDRLLLMSATPPAADSGSRAVTVAPQSWPALQSLGLKPGQRVTAEVVAQTESGETEIAIGGQRLTVALPAARPVGASLTLLVQGTSEQPRLVLSPEVSANPPADIAALRQSAMANQGSLGTVLAGLARLQGAPEPVAAAAAALSQAALPLDSGEVSGNDLRQAMLRSGTFLEAGGVPASGDIKAALMSLRGALSAWLGMDAAALGSGAKKPAPPVRGAMPRSHPVMLPDADNTTEPTTLGRHLIADTDAALDRVRLFQLASLPDPNTAQAGRTMLHTVEIPLRLGNELSMAQFQVLRDGGGQGNAEAPAERGWQMRFSVNYAVLGEVGAQITLRGRRVSVALWAERQATATALEAMLPELRPGLSARGIEPVALNCRLGRPHEPLAASSGQYVDAVK
jgi:hypothetical protein